MTVTEHTPDPAAGSETEHAAAGDQPDHEAVGIGVIRDSESHADAAEGAGADTADVRTSGEPLDASQGGRLPGLSRDDPAELETITGVVVQTRQDTGTASSERIVQVLRERLGQAGVDVSDEELEELARQVSTGDAEETVESPQGDQAAGG